MIARYWSSATTCYTIDLQWSLISDCLSLRSSMSDYSQRQQIDREFSVFRELTFIPSRVRFRRAYITFTSESQQLFVSWIYWHTDSQMQARCSAMWSEHQDSQATSFWKTFMRASIQAYLPTTLLTDLSEARFESSVRIFETLKPWLASSTAHFWQQSKLSPQILITKSANRSGWFLQESA